MGSHMRFQCAGASVPEKYLQINKYIIDQYLGLDVLPLCSFGRKINLRFPTNSANISCGGVWALPTCIRDKGLVKLVFVFEMVV